MSSKPSIPLRVAEAADRALAEQRYVSLADVLLGMGWLDPSAPTRWRTRQIPSLESALGVGAENYALATRAFEHWVAAADLEPIVVVPMARTAARDELRASESGDPDVEAVWRTHWLPKSLAAKERARVVDALLTPPELVAIDNRNDWQCHRCGGQTLFSMMEPEGPACLVCVGLGELVFLPSGDAKVTRAARKASTKQAVVVRWAGARKRYERIGYLIEQAALDRARASVSGGKR